MCTLIAIHRRVPGLPLVVAANRDEHLDRPAEGPAIRRSDGREVVAPLDLRAGGTWIGLSARGVFAALTNVRCPQPDPTRKSRGWIVMEALDAESAEAAAARLEGLPRDAYNPFNCFVADAVRAFLVVYQDGPEVRELPPGVHVIGNVTGHPDPFEAPSPKIERILGRARACATLPRDRVLDALAEVCREHDSGAGPLGDTCVHVEGTYGTRSSILLQLGSKSSEGRLLYADGPPCVEPYQDYSSLLRELRQMPGYARAETLTRNAS